MFWYCNSFFSASSKKYYYFQCVVAVALLCACSVATKPCYHDQVAISMLRSDCGVWCVRADPSQIEAKIPNYLQKNPIMLCYKN